MMNSIPGESPQTAIRVDGLRVVRGGRVIIPGLDLEVPAGQVAGLLGPSGCGKSTLMRSIVGVQKVAGGEVTVLGRPAGSSALRTRVGYLTQAPSIYPDLTVEENLGYFAAVIGTPRRGVADEVARVLDLVSLTDHATARAGALSGGQESRVSLADGVTLLVSSHVMDEAVRCDRLLLMRAGELLADDTLDGVLAATGAADVEQAFLTLVDRAEEQARQASSSSEVSA
ncbi:MAG: ABC transporter ATP-binding protein [Kineosporiaceae bacterium]